MGKIDPIRRVAERDSTNKDKHLANRANYPDMAQKADATKAKTRSTSYPKDIEDETGMMVASENGQTMHSIPASNIVTTNRMTGHASEAGTFQQTGSSKKYGDRFKKVK